jgi:hypothetical protein
MSEARFTPGPWEINPDMLDSVDTYSGKENRVNEIWSPTSATHHWIAKAQMDEEGTANARLIAASPEMYGALATIRARIMDQPSLLNFIGEEWMAVVDAALTKAAGK